MNWLEKRYYKIRRFLASRNQKPISEVEWKKLQEKNISWFATDLNGEKYTLSALEHKGENLVNLASEKLSNHGLVIITDLVDNTLALKLGNEMKSELNQLVEELGEQNFIERDDILLQLGETKINGYRPKAAYHLPVATVRRKGKDEIDGGMFDLFGLDKWVKHRSQYQELYDILKKGLILNIVQKTSSVQQRQMNVYFNKEVQKTRHLHVDGIVESYKSFLYLTDVNTLDDGPYMYVPDSPFRNGELFKTFMANAKYSDLYNIQDVYLPYTHAIPVLGKAGSIAISNQMGIHGGHPQKEGHERLLMVDSYYD